MRFGLEMELGSEKVVQNKHNKVKKEEGGNQHVDDKT